MSEERRDRTGLEQSLFAAQCSGLLGGIDNAMQSICETPGDEKVAVEFNQQEAGRSRFVPLVHRLAHRLLGGQLHTCAIAECREG